MKTTGEERFRCVVVWMLLVILCLTGCVSISAEKKLLDEDGNVTAIIKARYDRCFVPQAFEGVEIDFVKGKCIIGKQESDTTKMMSGIAEGVARGLK